MTMLKKYGPLYCMTRFNDNVKEIVAFVLHDHCKEILAFAFHDHVKAILAFVLHDHVI